MVYGENFSSTVNSTIDNQSREFRLMNESMKIGSLKFTLLVQLLELKCAFTL